MSIPDKNIREIKRCIIELSTAVKALANITSILGNSLAESLDSTEEASCTNSEKKRAYCHMQDEDDIGRYRWLQPNQYADTYMLYTDFCNEKHISVLMGILEFDKREKTWVYRDIDRFSVFRDKHLWRLIASLYYDLGLYKKEVVYKGFHKTELKQIEEYIKSKSFSRSSK